MAAAAAVCRCGRLSGRCGGVFVGVDRELIAGEEGGREVVVRYMGTAVKMRVYTQK